jgi:hypothetical protein
MQQVVEKLTGEPLNFGGAMKRKRRFSRRLHRLRIDRRRTYPVAHVRSSACAKDSCNNEELDAEDAAVATKPCVPLQ